MVNIARMFGQKLQHRFFVETWSPGIASATLQDIVATGDLGTITWLEPKRKKTFLADPFPWPGKSAILCEEALLFRGKGRIISMSKTDDGYRRDKVILETEHHHSYPSIFVHDDITYMLPEAFEGPTILYRLFDTGVVESVCVISENRRLADSTLFFYDDRFWIACTDLGLGIDDNLCLLYADGISGPWHEHALTPVKTDLSSCRPAGPVFSVKGILYRPAQDCSITYGGGIAINRIDVLTTDNFSETTVVRLKPDPKGPFPDGLHTLSSDGSQTWIDGKRFVFHLPTFLARVRRKMFGFF